MSVPFLHLPLDWEKKSAVIKLGLRLGQNGWSEAAPLAPLYFVRIWAEWASNPERWRPLNLQMNEVSGHHWLAEDLTFIIEGACHWPAGLMRGGVSSTGILLRSAIEAGVYEIEKQGEISGLALVDWWRCNEHLSPTFKTMQQKGGLSTSRATNAKLARAMAQQQQQIWSQQGLLLLTTQTDSKEEQRAALALVIQLDRHCGKTVRVTADYNEGLIRDAVAVIRRHAQDAIDAVLTHLSASRERPDVVKIPERVLEGFDDYLAAATREGK